MEAKEPATFAVSFTSDNTLQNFTLENGIGEQLYGRADLVKFKGELLKIIILIDNYL